MVAAEPKTRPRTREEEFTCQGERSLLLSVIIPARNEADCLANCLKSLIAQSEETFLLGKDWELFIVDDHSKDGTRAIAEEFSQTPGVSVLEPAPLSPGWTGKANAVWTAAQVASGKWLLFTDADTEYQPTSLLRAIYEADRYEVGLLSYSPKQIVTGLWQRAVMPLVFSELVVTYPSKKVNDPESEIAAGNGQFMLFRRETYFEIGGHKAVAEDILEDVALARLVKKKKLGLRFRYAEDAVSAHMYRSTWAMIEGWTKNLDLLFGNTLAMAFLHFLDLALIVGLPVLVFWFWWMPWPRWLFLLLWIRTMLRFYSKRSKSDFSMVDCWFSILGLPLFILILCRSWFCWRIRKEVRWKGRSYAA
jgi:glycosyltransferase involved in cell wall biosynthesis